MIVAAAVTAVVVVAILVPITIRGCCRGAAETIRRRRRGAKIAKPIRGPLTVVVPAVLAVVALSCFEVTETVCCPLAVVAVPAVLITPLSRLKVAKSVRCSPTIAVPAVRCLKVAESVRGPLTIVAAAPLVLAVSLGRLRLAETVRRTLAVPAVLIVPRGRRVSVAEPVRGGPESGAGDPVRAACPLIRKAWTPQRQGNKIRKNPGQKIL